MVFIVIPFHSMKNRPNVPQNRESSPEPKYCVCKRAISKSCMFSTHARVKDRSGFDYVSLYQWYVYVLAFVVVGTNHVLISFHA